MHSLINKHQLLCLKHLWWCISIRLMQITMISQNLLDSYRLPMLSYPWVAAVMEALLHQKPASAGNLVCIFPLQFTCRRLSSCSEFTMDTGLLHNKAPVLWDMIIHILVGNSNMLGSYFRRNYFPLWTTHHLHPEFHKTPVEELTGGWPCYYHINKKKSQKGNLYS
jgi:hypothetical protein